MLQIKGISKQYRTGELVQQALNDVSLNLRDNEFVSILGPSGSGKTTLLNVIVLTVTTPGSWLSTVFPRENIKTVTGTLTETILSALCSKATT
jgi:ABC-type lipoprotein export system ATPase subunit